ncbi:hypothetical protein EDB89DRAFT_1639580 [Lactarius sanguifluus]|nr:hypothetical protein EDB89DRAFT_1639580 [Lactarius sanguifluus]
MLSSVVATSSIVVVSLRFLQPDCPLLVPLICSYFSLQTSVHTFTKTRWHCYPTKPPSKKAVLAQHLSGSSAAAASGRSQATPLPPPPGGRRW